jgi:hypothetical protein
MYASRSAALVNEYRLLWYVLEDLHVQLQVVRVPSRLNRVNAKSRFVGYGEGLSLGPSLVPLVERHVGAVYL